MARVIRLGSRIRRLRGMVSEVQKGCAGRDARSVGRYGTSPPTNISAGTLFYLAQQHRADWQKPSVAARATACAEDRPDGGFGGGATKSSVHPKQADILIKLSAAAELFHTPDGTAYADLKINGHRETWAIKTKGFRQWLARQLYIRSGGAPNSEALKSALNIIEATARFDARERTVHVRVGELGDKLYLDLADQQWRAVEIDSNGWRVVADPPVRFRRPAGMLPLPVPERGGCIDDLRPFLNISNEADFVLLVAWILAALHDRGPYPVLVLSGEQGSAKTFRAAVLRLLTTGAPRARPARTPPTRTVRASNVSTARETTPSPAGVGTSSEPEPNARALSAVVPTTSTTSRRGC